MRNLSCLALLVLLCGCTERPEPLAEPPSEPQTAEAPAPAGGGDGLAIVGPETGGIAPVVGGDSVSGGGSNVGNVMKERAKGIASQPNSSLPQTEDGANDGT